MFENAVFPHIFAKIIFSINEGLGYEREIR